MRGRVALAAALVAVAALPAPEAHGVAKVGLGVAGIRAPAPTDANMWVGTTGAPVKKGKLSAAATPKVRVKSGRPKGVVVVYGFKRIKKTSRYRLLMFAIRGRDQTQTSKAAKNGNEIAIETLEFSGGRRLEMRRTDAVNSVVGSNREPKHKMLDLDGFRFGTAGGQLAPDARGAEFMTRYAYRQAFDLSGDPDDDEFLRALEGCCEAK